MSDDRNKRSTNMAAITRKEGLISAAIAAGIKTPSEISSNDPASSYHWDLFCAAQLDRPLVSNDSHYKNAKIIAKVPVGTAYADIKNLLE